MTVPPPIDAWVLEAECDLVTDRYDDTTRIVSAWAAECAFEQGSAFNIQYSGRTDTAAFDAFSVTGDATPEQIEALVMVLHLVCGAPITVRRTRLEAVPHLGMTDGQPNGAYSFVDPELGQRALKGRSGAGGKDVN